MRNRRTIVPASVVIILLLASGCAPKNPNAVPTPAPIQVANSVNALAQSVDAATAALIAARDQGKLSQADLNIAFKVITAVSSTGKYLNAELRSADTWDVQKIRMRNIVVASGLAELSKQLPPNARVLMAAVLATFNSISTGFGGPTI
jgi:hypothetical protein